MDVTDEILKHAAAYGSSTSFKEEYYSAQKSLNYASGASINKPDEMTISSAPANINFKDDLGLFGTENYYLKVKLDLDPTSSWIVELDNKGSGNKYQDVWLDIALRDESKTSASSLKVKGQEFFYISVHARNTKRLGYNFDLKITAS